MEPSEAIRDIRHSLHALSQPLAAVTGMVDLLLLELPKENSLFKEIQLIDQQLVKVVEIIAHIRRIAADASKAEGQQLF
jgi:signal transduction histidine kinase